MKFLSLLLILLAMQLSWAFIRTQPKVPESIHIGIQDDLKNIIQDYVQKNLPSSKDLVFQRFWTETLSEKKVRARFTYSFVDVNETSGNTTVEIDGYAILNKTEKETDQAEYWSFDELNILNNKIEFQQELRIAPKEDDTESNSTTE